jgi:HSP20 family protein
MAMMRYEPWSLMNQLNREMNQFFRIPQEGNGSETVSDWLPSVDIKENEHAYVLHADIPGVDPKDIEINMEDGVLTISGERHKDEEVEGEHYKRVERVRGSFYRRFNLPDTADAERISAKSSLGVLEVTIPKQEKVKPRRIVVEG